MTEIYRHAVLSSDGIYRYRLVRRWGIGPSVTFIMLNPSTGDAEKDDPTLSKCMKYARSWGFDALDVVNLYAFRSSDPEVLMREGYPAGGTNNDNQLMSAALSSETVVAAWGGKASPGRIEQVRALPGCEQLMCINHNIDGSPSHPLYLADGLSLSPWPSAALTCDSSCAHTH